MYLEETNPTYRLMSSTRQHNDVSKAGQIHINAAQNLDWDILEAEEARAIVTHGTTPIEDSLKLHHHNWQTSSSLYTLNTLSEGVDGFILTLLLVIILPA